MCDAEGSWNGSFRMMQLPDGVGSLASGEPPAEYARELSFRATVVDALTSEVAPDRYPAAQ